MRAWYAPLIVMLALTAWLALHATIDSRHLAAEPCDTCHLSSRVTESDAPALRGSQEKLCGTCHSSALEASHPSGLRPTRPLPPAFPLDWKGDLTCSTCHRIHDEPTSLTRSTHNGKSFCLQCHNEAFFQRMRDGGFSLIRSGHLDASPHTSANGLDRYSVQCIGCHDERLAGEGLNVTLDGRGLIRHASGSANHPIGVDYTSASRYGGYRTIETIDQRIVLPDGKVSCISCHEGYSPLHGKVLTTSRSLCLECHNL